MTRANRLADAFLVLLLSAAASEAAEVQGVVLENERGGPPMAGVQLRASHEGNPTTTSKLGEFKLSLPNRQPGEIVLLTVLKEGYQVVNEIHLEVTLQKPNDRKLILYLCKPSLCEEMRRRFFNLKQTEIVDKTYQERIRQLEKENRATREELAQLKKEREEALAIAEKAAEEQARSKPGQGSKVYREAWRLYLDGQTEEALAILNEAEIEASLDAARENTARKYILRGRILANKLQFDEAEAAYQAAVAASPESFEANLALGRFAFSQRRFSVATLAFQQCLYVARK